MTKVVINEEPINVTAYDEQFYVRLDDDNVRVSVENVTIDQTVITEEEEMYDIEVDMSVPNVTYVGQALPGTASTQPLWRIKRITETETGSSVDWANGSAEFSYRWTDRLSLTYGP